MTQDKRAEIVEAMARAKADVAWAASRARPRIASAIRALMKQEKTDE